MKKGYEKKLTKRLFAILVAVVMTVTVVPAMGAFAEGQDKAAGNGISGLLKGSPSSAGIKGTRTYKKPGVTLNISSPDATGKVRITGAFRVTTEDQYVYGATFTYLTVDGVRNRDYELGFGASTFNQPLDIKLNMSQYSVGYHTVRVYYNYYSGSETNPSKYTDYVSKTNVLANIVAYPSNSLSQYETYSTYFFFTSGANYSKDTSCVQYIDYKRKDESAWKTRALRDRAGTQYQRDLNGLTPNKEYQARVYYVKENANHTQIICKGPYSNVVTFRSGKAKTPVKSFTLKAYKVKRKKQYYYAGRRYFVRYGLVWSKPIYRYRYYYQYKLKAIVKMKKKPRAAGANICGKWVKGNKKKYTKALGTFTSYAKPKKRKMTVSFYTYLDRTYGGYSPIYKKKVRIK